jgi:4'-phosphopantetheinyl transferase EntD
VEKIFEFVHGIEAVLARISDVQDPLCASELGAAESFVDKRRMQFTAGRSAARTAMELLGEARQEILRGSRMEPVFPGGLVGSISHTDEFAAAAIARTSAYRAVGLDLEEEKSVGDDVIDAVLCPAELQRAKCEDDLGAATVLFSCKESVYKAVNPLLGEFLDFKDVSIRLDRNQFNAWCRSERKSAALISRGIGFFEIENGLVRTLFVI